MERTAQLLDQAKELQHRSDGLEVANRELAVEAIAPIKEVALRVGSAAEAADISSLRHQINELKRFVGSVQSFLRESGKP